VDETELDFSTPEKAVLSALAAYRSADTDLVMATKDLEVDARLFWQGAGIPILDNDQIPKTAALLRESFRREIEGEGIEDYNYIRTEVLKTDMVREDAAVVTLSCVPEQAEPFTLRLGLMRTATGWKLALAPGYDQL